MSDVYQLVGKEQRQYVKDGVKKFYCGLHFVSIQGGKDGVEGSAVEKVSCPSKVDPSRLQIGQWYEFKYDIYTMGGKMMARIADFIPYSVE